MEVRFLAARVKPAPGLALVEFGVIIRPSAVTGSRS